MGDPSVGKTSVLDRYINGDFNEKYNSTIAVDFKHVQPTTTMAVNTNLSKLVEFLGFQWPT